MRWQNGKQPFNYLPLLIMMCKYDEHLPGTCITREKLAIRDTVSCCLKWVMLDQVEPRFSILLTCYRWNVYRHL